MDIERLKRMAEEGSTVAIVALARIAKRREDEDLADWAAVMAEAAAASHRQREEEHARQAELLEGLLQKAEPGVVVTERGFTDRERDEIIRRARDLVEENRRAEENRRRQRYPQPGLWWTPKTTTGTAVPFVDGTRVRSKVVQVLSQSEEGIYLRKALGDEAFSSLCVEYSEMNSAHEGSDVR